MGIDVLIMIATEDEEKALLNYEADWEKVDLDVGFSFFRRIEGNVSFALGRGVDYGSVSATQMGQLLIDKLKPKALAMAGFCAGHEGKVSLGDVIIPRLIYDYEAEKYIGENNRLPEISAFRKKKTDRA